MRHAIFILGVLFTLQAFASEEAIILTAKQTTINLSYVRDRAGKCGHEEGDQSDQNICAQYELNEQEIQLKKSFENFLKTRKTKKLRKLALKEQQAWIRSRDKDCAEETAESYGGTSHWMSLMYCKAKLTKLRIDELEREGE